MRPSRLVVVILLLSAPPWARAQGAPLAEQPAAPPTRGETARAPSPLHEDERRAHATVGVGTDFPVAAGGRIAVSWPSRLRLSTSVGFMPGAYVDAINDAIVALDGYDEATGDLVKAAIRHSLVWRTHVGVRAWRGLYVEAGYGLVALGGAAATGDVIAVVTGRPAPPSQGNDRFRVDATLHMFDVEIGCDLKLSSRWQLRAALGGAFTVSADSEIRPDFEPTSPQLVAEFTDQAEAYLDDWFTSNGFTPVVSISIAYVLF